MRVSHSLCKQRNAVAVCCVKYSSYITKQYYVHTKTKQMSLQTIDKNRLLLNMNLSFILGHTIKGFIVQYLAEHEVPFLACCDRIRICPSDLNCVRNAVSIIVHSEGKSYMLSHNTILGVQEGPKFWDRAQTVSSLFSSLHNGLRLGKCLWRSFGG
jgi:hypothetical protein